MDDFLTPKADLRTRLIVFAVLMAPVPFAARMNFVWIVLSCFVPLILTGTYRIGHIKDGWFESQLRVGFMPFPKHRCKLAGVVTIFTRYDSDGPGFGTFILFGPLQYAFGFLMDRLIPALGGPYEIRLETAKGREIFAWQGFSQEHFEANLELLKNQTGAEVRLR